MPNLFSAFTNDVFRPLATLLIPGAIGVSTWFIALIWHFSKLNELVTRNRADSGLVLLLAAIFAGMIFEDLAARWEVQLDHWADARTQNAHSTNWWKYLQTSFKSEPIGRRYARALVLRLKFELGTAFALLSAALGMIWLSVLGLGLSATIWLELLCVSCALWLFKEAKDSHKVLSKTRAAILENIRVIG